MPFATCELEPIHLPGAIQPHGALLVASAETFVVTHASANLASILGHSPESALGRPLRSAIGEVAFRAVSGTSYQEHTGPGPAGSVLQMRGFRSGRYLCVDIQPDLPQESDRAPVTQLQTVLETFRHAADRKALCESAVRGLRDISRYDRVMAYRFNCDGDGEVIAEALASGLPPYLGLRYPASDVPPQARVLYLRQRVGAISDSAYEPVPLLADFAWTHAEPIDLTHSTLRSVSPLHRAYMRNMGTTASLTIALTHGAALWGMLVCHNADVRVASPALRAVADIIGQVVSLLIGTLTDAETNAQQLAREGMLTALAEALARPVSLQDALSAAQADLLGLVKAAGAIVRLSGATSFVGVTPADAERLLDMLMARCDGELLAIDDLGLRHSSFAHCASRASGALLLPIAPGREATGDAILWFRPEIVETVTWGGDPAEHSKQDLNTQQLSPRASFTAWKQIVAGRCMPWTAVDEAMARRLCGAVEASMAQRTKAELARLRHYDVLTGLPNRSLLQDRLTEIGHGPGPGAALLFLDLDRFKAVNDTLGHAAGDMLLVEVAHRLLAEAGPPQLTARLGGDEFVVLCRGLEPDGVTQLAERIRASVEAPYEIAGRTCHIAASIGIALAGKLGGLDLVRAADMAMYAAKQGGGNRGVLFEPALFDHATQQLDLENGLRQALAGRDELVLLYQPIFAIAAGTRSLAGFEALVRWRHPRHGWMSPAQFMPVAEKSGLILPLGEWVLATAAHQARVFQLIQAGGSLSMAVNISALQLSQPGFCAGLSGLLEAEGLPPAALCLEFTESILSDAADTATLAGIRALGARVAIDDFGMGHSALSYLRELPADAVKLDRSFLECADGSLENPAFVGAVTALIRAAGKSVVFEGIETQKQFDIVLAAGADMAQGFFLAPPLSANAAHGLVDQYKEAERRRNITMPNK